MKNVLTVFIVSLLLFNISCHHEAIKSIQNCCLSNEDSLLIIEEIFEATDNYAYANINMDFDKAANFYVSSSDFKLAENGKEYANWDSLYLTIKNTFQALDSVDCIWGERNVIPLKPDAATLYSRLSFKTKSQSGDVYEATGIFTGLLIKKDGVWKSMQSHFSIDLHE